MELHLPGAASSQGPAAPSASGRTAVLVAMVLALGVLTIDVTVVRVALPTMQRELGLSDVGQQWIVNAYVLAQAVLVVIGGRAGDLWGRRRVFLAGLVVFTAGSVLSGAAQGEAWIIVSRLIQGAGAAVMLPGCFSIVTDAYRGPDLGRGMGALSGASAIGLSLGPLIGGLLIDLADWRWIFFVNVPIAAAAGVLTLRHVPDRPGAGAGHLDLRGLTTLIAGIGPLVLALMQGETWGWDSAATISLLVVAALGLAAFVRFELRSPDPLVQLRILRVRPIAAGNATAASLQFTITAATVFLAIYLQNVLGNSALDAGLLLLPVTVPIMIFAPLAGRMTGALGARVPAAAGMALCAAGAAWMGAVSDAGSAAPLVAPMVVFGIGMGIAMTVMTTAVMGGADANQRGMVSGVYNTVRYTAAALGIAVTTALFYGVASDRLDQSLASGDLTAVEERDVEGLLAGSPKAEQRIAKLAPGEAATVESAARDAFADAFGITMLLLAAVAALGALTAALFLRGNKGSRGPP